MDHNFVLNVNSFPALDHTQGFNLLLDSVRGMIAVVSDHDSYAIYADQLNQFEIAPNFKYCDFLDRLGEDAKLIDLQLALMECADKSPMFNFLNDEEFQEVSSATYFFSDEAYTTSNDVLAMAWFLEASLLSIATSEKWLQNEICFCEYVEGSPLNGNSYLRNISSVDHGKLLRITYDEYDEINVIQAFPNCVFSNGFNLWLEDLAADLKSRVINKLDLANTKNFQGGEPLFKALEGTNSLREIRFSAVQGGAVRIIFKQISNGKNAVLVGFVKKSNSGGYKEAINLANKYIKELA